MHIYVFNFFTDLMGSSAMEEFVIDELMETTHEIFQNHLMKIYDEPDAEKKVKAP